ncbi:acyl-CoA carboxylase epsilon subunit [Micromonospora parathelypteridis]|uniref:Acyl-CoA carboxylase subunit epsilon n=1 Tax=Micromonospora parathelypteridis TaxID=1839617 RepID=A0A840VJV0_9ACTN|nr:acyl-CoA carboxylase epsilon subunit [Micromonospora parathelypteridis]MBB5476136.1 hypothetical protein [Micromonospora parathelypteridis]
MSTAMPRLVVHGDPSDEELATIVVAALLRSRSAAAAGAAWAAPARRMTGRPVELGQGAWRTAGWMPPPTR